MSASNFHARSLVLSGLVAALLAAGIAGGTSAQQGPPPQGPPLLSDPASQDSELAIMLIRTILQQEGDAVIESANEQGASLSWSSGAQPVTCGYECVGPPGISATDHVNQPNQYVARVRGHLDFHVDVGPFDRTIRTNVTIDVICSGWRDGDGTIVVVARSDPPFVAGGGGLVEDILDFILLPADLSGRITEGINARLPGGSVSSTDLGRDCDSLGVSSNYDSGNWRFDSVFWQEPPTSPLGIGIRPLETLPFDTITVDLQSVTRRKTLSEPGTEQGVYFDVFVNGQLIGIPPAGAVDLEPEETLALDIPPIVIPAGDADDLQVIVADSLGGSGWVAYDRQAGFGEGGHTLTTHRTEFRPPPELPEGDGFPQSNKPVPFDVQEFELSFTVDYVPRPTVIEGPN